MDNIIVSDVESNVVTITLNRPKKKNALSIALRDEVSSALTELAAYSEVKVVVITGAGDVFSAGFDMKEFQQGMLDKKFNAKIWASSDRFHHSILFFPLPIIAAVNGPAIGGGFDLATLCDIRVCTENTVFSHPEIAFGEVMYSPLHELLGGAIARDICLTGRKIDAKEALALNLVSSCVTTEELGNEISRMVKHITRASRENLVKAKSKIVQRANITGRATLEL